MTSKDTQENGASSPKIIAKPSEPKKNTGFSQDVQTSEIPEPAGAQSTTDSALQDEGGGSVFSGQQQQPEHERVETLKTSVQDLSLLEQKEGVSGSDTAAATAAAGNESPLKTEGTYDDAQTHLSNSSTKPTSFDSKSMASVTTFAMDEKESLRPDDSASVQAVEEDEAFSGSISGAQNSRIGSDAGGQLNRASVAAGVAQPIPGVLPGGPKAANPSGGSPSDIQDGRHLHGFPNEPDEKLLEAMDSPKDRLLILQLEEKIINFIKNSSEQSLELPPCNAFGRLLAHKLGDYYHLTHFVDNNVTSVRLHRTPWCRLPTPMPMLQTNTNKTPPPNVPTMKIMRRVGQPNEKASGESTGPNSSVPSKATSEAGADASNDGAASSTAATPAKDRATLSREEREAKYQEARERIFRDFPESKSSDSPKSGEQSANISRSNSKTGRKKGNRQKMAQDDGFEARSQFSPYYYGAPYPGGQMPYNGAMHDSSFSPSTNYMVGPHGGVNVPPGTTMQPMYPPHGNLGGMPQQYPMNPPSFPSQGTWQPANMQQQTSPAGGYPAMPQMPSMVSQRTPARPSQNTNLYIPSTGQHMQAPQPWVQSQYQPNFQQSPPGQRNPGSVPWPSGPPNACSVSQMPYNYGQAGGQSFPQMPPGNPPQHPLPGSFSRQSFNPQSTSFAPGGNSHQRYPENNGNLQPSGGQFNNLPSWPNYQENTNPSPRNVPASRLSPARHNAAATSSAGASPTKPGDSQASIAKWGTPAHLPPKPPAPQALNTHDPVGRSSASSAQNGSGSTSTAQPTNGPFVVSGATSRQKSQLQGGVP